MNNNYNACLVLTLPALREENTSYNFSVIYYPTLFLIAPEKENEEKISFLPIGSASFQLSLSASTPEEITQKN